MGDGPRSRGPNDDFIFFGKFPFPIHHIERNIHRFGGDILIFHLGFGQGAFAARRPINGFEALIDDAIKRHFGENIDLTCLIFGKEREIRVLIIA